MVEFLANINDYIAAIVVILASIPLLILARDMTLDWGKKIIYLAIIVGVWNVFATPITDDLQALAVILLSTFIFTIMTESTAILLEQVFLFTVTLSLFRWVFKVDNPGDDSVATAPGFRSRPL